MDDLSRLRDQLNSMGGRPGSKPGQGQPGGQQYQPGQLSRDGQPGQNQGKGQGPKERPKEGQGGQGDKAKVNRMAKAAKVVDKLVKPVK